MIVPKVIEIRKVKENKKKVNREIYILRGYGTDVCGAVIEKDTSWVVCGAFDYDEEEKKMDRDYENYDEEKKNEFN